MTVEETIALLEKENPKAEVFVCHWAKTGATARPIIRPLAEVRWQCDQWHPTRLCLIEDDGRREFLTDV